ncbi:MAG TPA: DUF4176 domain-containing protein [Candidatus Onthousia faecavium]|nr:DUF4176 domain-containing protein [Candidatus Onthousia faecavium]
MNYEKYLPIGTVVLLKGGKKRVMITGFCCTDKNNNDKVYDYVGCLYPEGVITSDKNLLFDHSQIDQVYHLGLVDDEEQKFKKSLQELMAKVSSF